jgi:hypothetical protein
MPTRKSPSTTPRCLGQFWMPGSDEPAQVTGAVEVLGTRVELEVSPELTARHTYTQLANLLSADKVSRDHERDSRSCGASTNLLRVEHAYYDMSAQRTRT